LRRYLRIFDNIEVEKLQVTNADCRELYGDLSADRADADYGYCKFRETRYWNEVLLSNESAIVARERTHVLRHWVQRFPSHRTSPQNTGPPGADVVRVTSQGKRAVSTTLS